MSYLDQINAFDRWLETHHLPPLAQLLWYRIMALCNRAMWPEWMQVDNRRLMVAIGTGREKTLVDVRSKLIDAGLIEYRKGHKGNPGKYRICPFTAVYTFNNEVKSEVYTEVQSAVKSAVYTDAIIDKDKTRLKVTTPLPPDDLAIFSGGLKSAVEDWFAYKAEKRQPYKPTGRRNLLAEITNNAAKYGDKAVADVIRQSMSSNYQGIVWDRLKGGASYGNSNSAQKIKPVQKLPGRIDLGDE